MEISVLLVFAGALILAAGLPGPSIAALVAQVLTRGARSVLPFLLAMWIGEAMWLSFAVFGLVLIAETLHGLFVVVKYAGVLYLAYLAWKMWHAPTGQDALPAAGDRPWRMFLAGLAVTLGNPKIMMFYLALLPSIVDLARVGVTAWAELVATALLVVIAVDFFYLGLADRLRRFVVDPARRRAANRIGAVAMGGAAAALAARS
jgi:threonine/homoserine/homoserine lactone efflux protein